MVALIASCAVVRLSLAWLQPVNEMLLHSIFALIQRSIRATSQLLERGESKDKEREKDKGNQQRSILLLHRNDYPDGISDTVSHKRISEYLNVGTLWQDQ